MSPQDSDASDNREGASAPAELVSQLYPQLRALASAILQGAAARHTLQPTGLVHELYLRLAGREVPGFRDQAHFMAVAARAMRQILADYARRARAHKRGGHRIRVPLDENMEVPTEGEFDLVALDSALTRLSRLNDRQARIVELRFLAGLPMEHIARELDVSVETVKRDWRVARAWLMTELAGGDR